MLMTTMTGSAVFPVLSLKEEEAWPSHIQAEKDWWHDRKAEVSRKRQEGTLISGTLSGLSMLCCSICDIYIGFGHEEQDLYFLLVYNQWIKVGDEPRANYYDRCIFQLCHACAQRKEKRNTLWHILLPASWPQLEPYSSLRIFNEVSKVRYLYECFLSFLIWIADHQPAQAHFFFRWMTQPLLPAGSFEAATPEPAQQEVLQHVASFDLTPQEQKEDPLQALSPEVARQRREIIARMSRH